jgi:hypothetical protein
MRRHPILRCAALGLPALALGACAAKRPVLYPNVRYQEVGEAVAQRDVDECIALAESHGRGAAAPAARAGAQAAGGAAVGAATGAAVGAVLGSAGRGAAAGAAGGGAGSLARSLFSWRELDPIERSFVQECLHERGYRVIGWD